jgi:hypothetical protein
MEKISLIQSSSNQDFRACKYLIMWPVLHNEEKSIPVYQKNKNLQSCLPFTFSLLQNLWLAVSFKIIWQASVLRKALRYRETYLWSHHIVQERYNFRSQCLRICANKSRKPPKSSNSEFWQNFSCGRGCHWHDFSHLINQLHQYSTCFLS